MAITAVAGQETGTMTLNASASVAFPGNVTAGNIVIVIGLASIAFEAPDPFISGDCTKIAGTATIGTIALRKQTEVDRGDGVLYELGIWDAQVTGSGSLTMQITNSTVLNNAGIAVGEYTSGVGAISFDAGQTNAGTGTSTAADSGSVTTTRNGLIIGALDVNSATVTTLTPDGAFTTIFEEENGVDFLVASAIRRITTGSVADSASWTLGSSNLWVAAVAAYVEPAAGGGGPTLPWLPRTTNIQGTKGAFMIPSGMTPPNKT